MRYIVVRWVEECCIVEAANKDQAYEVAREVDEWDQHGDIKDIEILEAD
jgi:hypothetical protein